MKEFDIIERFFRHGGHQRKDVTLGIGDDCAVVNVPDNQRIAITTDTLVAGVHFFEDAAPQDIAHKALAVNLSDLAAMGAEPAWISLSLSLPEADLPWLEKFSASLFELTQYYSVQLIGGDTVQGPLSITITAQGFTPGDSALTRSGASPGDWLYVTGNLGDAGLGLDVAGKKVKVAVDDGPYFLEKLNRPNARVLAGTLLRRIASSCIDISDGLVSDLSHILTASGCGATVNVDKLPLSEAMKRSVSADDAFHYALSAGDDYELLFTVSEEQKGNLDVALASANISATCIGQMTGNADKLSFKFGNEPYQYDRPGYEHF